MIVDICKWCEGERIELATKGPGSFIVVLCEVCDAGAVATMWGDA